MKLKTTLVVALLLLSASVVPAAPTPAASLLVLEKEQNTLLVIDPGTLSIVARIPAGNDPHEVAVSDDGRFAYVSNYQFRQNGGGTTIAVIDLVAQKPLAPIELGALRAPHGLMFAGGKLYFTAELAKVVGRYDPATRTIDWVMGTGQDRTHMVAVSRDLNRVFTSNVSSATISVIERRTLPPPPGGARGPNGGSMTDWAVSNIPVGKGSEGFDVSPDGRELWVANAQDSTISIIDVAQKQVVKTVPSTRNANRLKFTPDGRSVFVSDLNGNELLILDAATREVKKKIAMPGNSEGLVMQPDGARAYTTLNSRNAVAIIDLKTFTVVGEVQTGKGPDGLAWAARK